MRSTVLGLVLAAGLAGCGACSAAEAPNHASLSEEAQCAAQARIAFHEAGWAANVSLAGSRYDTSSGRCFMSIIATLPPGFNFMVWNAFSGATIGEYTSGTQALDSCALDHQIYFKRATDGDKYTKCVAAVSRLMDN